MRTTEAQARKEGCAARSSGRAQARDQVHNALGLDPAFRGALLVRQAPALEDDTKEGWLRHLEKVTDFALELVHGVLLGKALQNVGIP